MFTTAGVAAFTTPTDEFVEVLAAKPDINGNRASFGYGYGPAWQTTLPAGDYLVRTSKGDKQSETPLSVKAGERTELALTLPSESYVAEQLNVLDPQAVHTVWMAAIKGLVD